MTCSQYTPGVFSRSQDTTPPPRWNGAGCVYLLHSHSCWKGPVWGVGCMTQMFVSRRDRVAMFFFDMKMFFIGKLWWMTRPENMAASPLKDKGQSIYSTWADQTPIACFVGTKKYGLTDHKGHVWWVVGIFSLLIDAVVLPVRRSCFLSFHLHGATDLCGWLNQSQWEHYHSQGLDQAGCPAFGTMALSHVSSLEGCTYSCSCMFVAHHMTAPKFG